MLIFRFSPILERGELESELIGLARGLVEAGLSPKIAGGCPSFAEPGGNPAAEASRREWTLVDLGTAMESPSLGPRENLGPKWLVVDAEGIQVDLLVIPTGGGTDGGPPVVVGAEAAFLSAVARARPSIVLFTDRWPSRPFVDACRVSGIASVFLFRGIGDSLAEPNPAVDAVVALSET